MKATTIHPIPNANFRLPAVVCMPKGEALFTNFTTVNGNEPLNYEWNFGDGSPVSTTMQPRHVYAAAGSWLVTLKATSAFGCSNSTSRTLSSFAQQPVAAFTEAPDQVCQGSEVFFTDESTSATGSVNGWSWDLGDGTNATQRNPVKRFANAGTYHITLTVTNSMGCTSDAVAKDIPVHVQPVVDAGPSFTVAEGTVVTFNPKVNDNNLVFAWTPAGELNNASLLRPSFIARHDQMFTLTATDGSSNCSASDQLTVKIIRPVKVPNAFSPNGDGINDTWIITNLIDYQGNTVEVFNRYGQRVFYSIGYNVPWDGRYNGNPVPSGVYYYVIDLKNGFGKLTGSITVIR
jgi:gliding motility-associated-like protein